LEVRADSRYTYGRWYRFLLFWPGCDKGLAAARVDPDYPHQQRAVSEINDIANDPNRYLAAEVKCKVSLTVPADAVSVTVHFDLNRPGCDAKTQKS